MSSRAFRRLTRNTDHGDLPDTSADPGESNDSVNETSTGFCFSNFSLLQSTPPTEEPVTISDSEEETEISPPKPQKSRKKKHQNKKKKPKVDKNQGDRSKFNSADLDELAAGEPDVTEILPVPDVQKGSIDDLLVCSTKMLDPIAELGRIFGPNVVNDNHISHQNRVKRGPLIRIKPTWPPVARFGLDMKKLDDGTYTFTHSKEYRKIQKLFYMALNTYDPSNLTQVLANCPYHIDSLLQLSDVLIQQDNSEVGIDLLERALHAFQSAFHPLFNPLIGHCRLNYRYQENRGLFVALFRFIIMVGTRGCYRTALEYCKILLSLDIDGDPLAVLLMIDSYALLSQQIEFLLEFYDRLNPSRNLYLLPNFAFSIPLAMKLAASSKSKHSDLCKANEKLQDALIMFPGFISRLLKRTTIGGATNLDKSVLFGKEVMKEPESLGRLLDLYVARTYNFWTHSDVQQWVEYNLENVLNLVEPQTTRGGQDQSSTDPRLLEYSERRKTLYPALPRNVNRHLILAGIPEAPPLLVPDSSRHIYNFDPLPPDDSFYIYRPEEDRQVTGSGIGLLSSLFASILPSYSEQRPAAQIALGAADDDQGADASSSSSSSRTAAQALREATEQLTNSIRHVLEQLTIRPAVDEDSTSDATNRPHEDVNEPE